jgi:hypothetical protein
MKMTVDRVLDMWYSILTMVDELVMKRKPQLTELKNDTHENAVDDFA